MSNLLRVAVGSALMMTAVLSCSERLDGSHGLGSGRAHRAESASVSARPSAGTSQLPLRLAIVTDLEGVLEPCGCTRDSKGGLDRLAYALSDLRRQPNPLLTLAAGNLLFPPAQSSTQGRAMTVAGQPTAQAMLKADTIAALLDRMDVDVAAPGPVDFARGSSALRSLARGAGIALLGSTPTPIEGLDALAHVMVRRTGDHRVGLLAGTAADQSGPGRSVARLRQTADIVVAFLHGDEEFQAAGSGAARPDVIVRTGLGRPGNLASVDDGVIQILPRRHGQELVLLELWPMGEPDMPWQLEAQPQPDPTRNVARVQSRTVDAGVPRDPDVRRLLDQIFTRINSLNRSIASASVESRMSKREAGTRPTYVGARTCGACHVEAYLWWTQTQHARAYERLVKRRRELDLDCIGCHVTGFDEPGGARLGRLDELKGVGCESCHGPGGAHVDDPRPPHRSVRRVVTESHCLACHDPAHSDDFVYSHAHDQLIAPGHGEKARSAAVKPAPGASADGP
jgi:hypothetical protein